MRGKPAPFAASSAAGNLQFEAKLKELFSSGSTELLHLSHCCSTCEERQTRPFRRFIRGRKSTNRGEPYGADVSSDTEIFDLGEESGDLLYVSNVGHSARD